ncbi:MAG: hypothetical protein GY861_12465 [bacterium]|nr:hypothetical protein [bacterium]
MGAESFLKEMQKKSGQKNGYNMNSIAPSRRHDINQMGGYNMQSGQFTGNGPDGILQSNMPTQRRMDANGQRYLADEGEVVITDAATIQAYGGAEALDSFIQQHRPGGNGQQPSGMPQPSNGQPQAIGPQQLGMIEDARRGVEQFQEGGVPTQDKPIDQISRAKPQPGLGEGTARRTPTPRPNPSPIFGPKPNPKPTPTPTPTPTPPKPFPFFIPKEKPTPYKEGEAGRTPTPPRIPIVQEPWKPGGYQEQEVNLGKYGEKEKHLGPYQEVEVNMGKYGEKEVPLKPYQEKEWGKHDPAKVPPTTPPGPGGAPVTSMSEYDEMLLNRYMSRLGAMNESERAAEAQRFMQAGGSDREAMARGAISDVSRRSAAGDVVSDFAIDAAKREEERAKFGKEMSFKEKQLAQNQEQVDLAQQKFDLLAEQQGFDNTMTQALLGISAGDYEGVNKVLGDLGLNPIDFDKISAKEDADAIIAGIDNMIAGLGPDADPKLLGFLAMIKGKVNDSLWKALGIDSETMTFTDKDGNEISYEDFVNTIDDPDNGDPATLGSMLSVGENTKVWLDETLAGELFTSQLGMNTEGQSLMDSVMGGDEASAGTLGQLVGAAITQDMGGKLNAAQKDLLKKYDMYDEEGDIGSVGTGEVNAIKTRIKKLIKGGNIGEAQQLYDNLSDEEKKLVGDFSDYTKGFQSQEEYDEHIKKLTEGNYGYNIDNLPKDKDDPIYQALLNDANTLNLTADGGINFDVHTGAGNNQYFIPELGARADHIGMNVKKGDLINMNGNLMVFNYVRLKTEGGPDINIYHFTDPVTGKDFEIEASGESGGAGNFLSVDSLSKMIDKKLGPK